MEPQAIPLQRRGALTPRECALLADLDVHPRVAMEILRHADFAVTTEIYTQVSAKQTRDALRRLGEGLE